MRIVAVSQRVDEFPGRNERHDALDQRLTAFLSTAGYVPVPVPNRLYQETREGDLNREAFDAWMRTVNPRSLVLSGGNDIGTCRERDLTEGWLLAYAKQHGLPALGICRGMQMMGHWSGAGLKLTSRHVQARHALVGEICGEVNSYHRYALAGCPPDYETLARSDDGEIEAIRHQIMPWEGWMWHPEREPVFASRDINRLRDLFL